MKYKSLISEKNLFLLKEAKIDPMLNSLMKSEIIYYNN